MNKEEFAELAAGFALSALSPADERVFIAALVAHPEWRSLVEDDSATVAALASVTATETPPASIRESLLAAVAATPQETAVPLTETGSEPPLTTEAILRPMTVPITVIAPRARRLWFGLAAAAALVLVLGFGAGRLGEYMQRPASVVAMEQIQQAPDSRSASTAVDAGGTVTAMWSESVGSAMVQTSGLSDLEANKTYELWVIRDGVPVAAGLLEASGGSETVILGHDVKAGDIVAVTIEPTGGSPDGVPSGDPIATIPAV